MSKRVPRPAANVIAPMHPALKDLIEKAAGRAGMHLNEWIAKLVADEIGRPDLAAVPRRKPGRKKQLVLVAS